MPPRKSNIYVNSKNWFPLLFGILAILVVYLYYIVFYGSTPNPARSYSGYVSPNLVGNQVLIPTSGLSQGQGMMNVLFSGGIASRQDPFNDPYSPPLKNDGVYFPTDSGDIRGLPSIVPNMAIVPNMSIVPNMASPSPAIPINVQSRGYALSYSQLGILTKTTEGSDLILPLMGRRIMNGRQKYQYYTISNTGSLNTKLPIKFRGQNASGEYGCDELNTGDIVHVEGYNHSFRSTVYENSLFNYIPAI